MPLRVFAVVLRMDFILCDWSGFNSLLRNGFGCAVWESNRNQLGGFAVFSAGGGTIDYDASGKSLAESAERAAEWINDRGSRLFGEGEPISAHCRAHFVGV